MFLSRADGLRRHVRSVPTQSVGTRYNTGVSGDLYERTKEHKSKETKGFTSRYEVTTLVYYEEFDDPISAIEREKQIKKWNRKWKIELIEKHNPAWSDLIDEEGIMPYPKRD